MRKLFLVCTFFLFLINVSESKSLPKHNAMQTLNLLAFGGAAQLKYQMGGEPGGEAVDLDDSNWDITFPGFKWPQSNTNVWFRTKINIPQKVGGFSLIGHQMKLYLYIDNGGDVFVNGDSLGTFEWGTAEFVLVENLKAGDEIVLAVRGINRPGWGKVSDFRIEFSDMVNFQKRLQPKYWGLMIARDVAVKLSKNPGKWLKIIDEVAENIVNSKAFMNGNEDELLAVFDREVKALKELDKEVKSKYHLYCAGYSHIDLAWQWPWIEGREVVKNTSESVLNIMERFPDFKYSMGQAHAYEWMENYTPDIFTDIQKKVREGKWEIVGGQWCEPDGNVPSGESYVRQSLYAKRYFRNKFGVNVKVCWIPDSFGFNWNLPQILARSGFEAFISKRIHLDDTRNFPHRLFWWQGPDGSKVLTYIPRDGYMHDLDGEHVIDFLKQEQKEAGLGKEFVMYGVGNHGGGPTMQMLDKASRTLVAPAYPNIQFCTSQYFFDSITPREKEDLNTWDSELYLERFRGCYTSQAKTKKHNRYSQMLIKSTEKISSISSLFGFDYPRAKIFDIWRIILFNQFHDILPGTSVNSVYHDTEREYTQAENSAALIGERALQNIAQNIDTRKCKNPIVIFNPNSWQRIGPVEVPLNDLEMHQEWSILDEYGNAVASQKIDITSIDAKLLFIAQDVPSMGYKTYQLVEKTFHPSNSALEFTRTNLENQFLKAEIDKNNGLLKNLFDKQNQRQVLSNERGNLLQILKNETNDAWNLKFTTPPTELDQLLETSLVEFGPVRATIKVVHSFSSEKRPHPTEDFPTSIFTQYISLYDGLPYLEVRNDMMWWEEHKVLKVAFPFNVTSDQARYEIPYGSIERPTGSETAFESARFEVPAQRWADLSDGKYGVSLLNDCKYGYDTKDNVMRLSLLRSPTFPDPMADKGYHEFKYAIYPHKGDFRTGQVFRKGFEFNEPFVVTRASSHNGDLPNSFSFISVEPESIILNSIKISEDFDNAFILRVYETHGKSAVAQIKTPYKIIKVEEVNMIEDKISDLETNGKFFGFDISANEIRTFRIQLQKN
jgi:alpha-mannosidase